MHPQYARCLPRGGSHICLFAQCSNPGPGGMRHWGAQVQCSSWGLGGAGRAPPPHQATSCPPRGAGKVSPQQAQRTEGAGTTPCPFPCDPAGCMAVQTPAPPCNLSLCQEAHRPLAGPSPALQKGWGSLPLPASPGVIPHTRSRRLLHPHAHPCPRMGLLPPVVSPHLTTPLLLPVWAGRGIGAAPCS